MKIRLIHQIQIAILADVRSLVIIRIMRILIVTHNSTSDKMNTMLTRPVMSQESATRDARTVYEGTQCCKGRWVCQCERDRRRGCDFT